MELIIKLNSQSAGRDKLARVVQYTSRLVWCELQKCNSDGHTVEQLKKLEATCSSFRKLLRFGRCVDSLYASLATINHPDYTIRLTVRLSKLCNSLFLFADHILWLTRAGFLKNVDSNRWSDASNKYWLFSITMNLIRDIYEVKNILMLERQFVFGRSAVSAECSGAYHCAGVVKRALSVVGGRRDVVTDTIKNLCDVFIPLAALGRIKLQPSTVGLLGAVSSLAGLVAILQPAAKLSPS